MSEVVVPFRFDFKDKLLAGTKICTARSKRLGVAHAHHEDYSKPYDVVWLCPPCHRNLHNELAPPRGGRDE